MAEKGNEIVLSDIEKQFIESQRKEVELFEVFKKEYSELVNKTGFSWMVDMNSPLNNIKLIIGKIKT